MFCPLFYLKPNLRPAANTGRATDLVDYTLYPIAAFDLSGFSDILCTDSHRLTVPPGRVAASSSWLAVMGSTLKIAAMVIPRPHTRWKASPILPPVVRACDRIATNKATQLKARERNTSAITQP